MLHRVSPAAARASLCEHAVCAPGLVPVPVSAGQVYKEVQACMRVLIHISVHSCAICRGQHAILGMVLSAGHAVGTGSRPIGELDRQPAQGCTTVTRLAWKGLQSSGAATCHHASVSTPHLFTCWPDNHSTKPQGSVTSLHIVTAMIHWTLGFDRAAHPWRSQ